ncbi:polyprenyl synthetase family protein [Chiayiivirga flava]|uniref:Farnesyl diphosphate synthase n=1 Tax=Chiayiivirga flava TaxID=659595 RepID=A0A7W8D8R1_9GAMM|nr:farnesyl diphosphate synthase [Chiayiivirga flava]MBB5208218.1 farnesyl diphosphate synthase [Chiayiivirga flava]
MTHPDPGALWRTWADRCETTLDRILPADTVAPQRLHAAMRHATLGGGKRMRPLLVYATGTAFGIDAAALDGTAAAVELIHAYSLVHDDLPAMDDDALRRGRPTVHVAFDEATAILAGDALQTLAFELLCEAPFEAGVRVAMLAALARASGAAGMVGGQALDLAAVGHRLDTDGLRTMHRAKTGALIRASVHLGALAAFADTDARSALDAYADALGLAFQIRDDILDVEGDPALIGKTRGKDAAHDKPTYPAILGMQASRTLLDRLAADMDAALDGVAADTTQLRALARFATTRAH